MTDKRAQLARFSTLVADTGDLDAILQLQPVDATTNPSLMLSVARYPDGPALLQQARELAARIDAEADLALCNDAFAAVVGQRILAAIPGWVSSEVDARLSFDRAATVARARQILQCYELLGADTGRVLIKIAATWEGLQAAAELERDGIRCNVTLVFNTTQALAAAERGATLISPFVGRIRDWALRQGAVINDIDDDPGVQSVRAIFRALKGRGLPTLVMGASFRSTEQIEALAGCDRLTIAPSLLDALAQDPGTLQRQLDPAQVPSLDASVPLTEAAFRWAMNDDAMASELLADGVRRFARDQDALDQLLEPSA